MATILELAREVRHRLVIKDTGCLKVDYDDSAVSIHFYDGSVMTDRGTFLSCFRRDPLDFQFTATDVSVPNEASGFGVSLLIEAIESIDATSLTRLWTRYSDWKIGFQLDPDIHNTLVKKHIDTKIERLRRLMRLAVSGSLTLEPPRASISDDIERINKMAAVGDWRQVLGLEGSSSTDTQIKQAFRKLATRLHPDRWVTTADPELRAKAEEAFKHTSQAYNELLKPKPIKQSRLAAKPKEQKKRFRISDFGFRIWKQLT